MEMFKPMDRAGMKALAPQFDWDLMLKTAGLAPQGRVWLAGQGPLPDWPGFELFTPALPHSARHASIRLAFEAAAEAAAAAAAKAPA
jgi:hypothetical protein